MADADHTWNLAVVQTGGFWSKPISLATRGRYTHAYTITGDATWSMEPAGLVQRAFDYWGDSAVYSDLQMTQQAKTAAAAWLAQRAHVGVEYDYRGDFIVGLDDITPAFLDPLFKRLEHAEDHLDPYRMFCSAFADDFASAAGIQLFQDGRPFHGVTPMDLYNLFVKKGWTK